ncbi:MAG: hypothetical protein AAGF79_03775 [Pseudomonadota bacterium]
METEVAAELSQRLNGPFSFRLFVQPGMALLFAILDGRDDARAGAEPFVKSILVRPGTRWETIASAWASMGKVLVIAFCLDIAFQLVAGIDLRIMEAVFMAILLCAVPYSLMRGPAARLFAAKTSSDKPAKEE